MPITPETKARFKVSVRWSPHLGVGVQGQALDTPDVAQEQAELGDRVHAPIQVRVAAVLRALAPGGAGKALRTGDVLPGLRRQAMTLTRPMVPSSNNDRARRRSSR